MKDIVSKTIIFATGATLGSLATWKYFKNKYECIANEEIESVKETFNNMREKEYVETGKKALEGFGDGLSLIDNEAVQKVKDICEEAGYANSDEKEGDEDMDKPYVIPPHEFGEMDGYDIKSLDYYTDGILTDDAGNIIEDIEELVGVESLNHFKEYEEDSVFVRNDKLKTDYEILMDYRSYGEVYKG